MLFHLPFWRRSESLIVQTGWLVEIDARLGDGSGSPWDRCSRGKHWLDARARECQRSNGSRFHRRRGTFFKRGEAERDQLGDAAAIQRVHKPNLDASAVGSLGCLGSGTTSGVSSVQLPAGTTGSVSQDRMEAGGGQPSGE